MRIPAPADLAALALPLPTTVRRYAAGVLYDNCYFQSPRLSEYSHKRFRLALWLGDPEHVEVFTPDGNWVGSATSAVNMTAAEVSELQVRRAAERANVTNAIRAGGVF